MRLGTRNNQTVPVSRWTESIAQKVKRKKKVEDNSKKGIWHSVFEPQYVATVASDGPVSLSSVNAYSHPNIVTCGDVFRSRPLTISRP